MRSIYNFVFYALFCHVQKKRRKNKDILRILEHVNQKV